jgi:hypothetical protein
MTIKSSRVCDRKRLATSCRFERTTDPHHLHLDVAPVH